MLEKLRNGSWIRQIIKPKISDQELHAKLVAVRQSLPVPVFWLLGKTQSGKSSIIRALTYSTRIEVGQGFRPCTQRTEVYDFPTADTAFLRFLDTKGLGEVAYDPQEDIAWCQQQAHLLMVVIKATDHELAAVREALQAIRTKNPQWPVVIVQTCLHEGYPDKHTEHLQPYPYTDSALSNQIPPDLLRSLLTQRAYFKDANARFVAVDFTQADDGYSPVNYGLEALWAELEQTLPHGLLAMLQQSHAQRGELQDAYLAHARPHIIGYAISAGLLGMTPIPAVGVPLVIAAQGKLFHSIASIYGLPLTTRSLYEVASAIGIAGLGMGLGVRELSKLIPGWGAVVAGLSTAAMTYALGMTLCYYYAKTQQGSTFTPQMLKTVYQEQLQQGRELLKDRFK